MRQSIQIGRRYTTMRRTLRIVVVLCRDNSFKTKRRTLKANQMWCVREIGPGMNGDMIYTGRSWSTPAHLLTPILKPRSNTHAGKHRGMSAPREPFERDLRIDL